jgi:hypothetical protein
MDFLSYGIVAILAVTLFLQIFRRAFLKRAIRLICLGVFVAVVGYWTYISVLQYQAFGSGPLGYTLHTTEGIRWFFGYVRLHYWNTHLISLIASVLLILIGEYFHKKKGKVFFEDEELYVAALGIFLVGYPALFAYILLMLLLPAIASAMFLKKGERMPLYYFWMPLAIILILLVQFWGANQAWWNSFRF